MERALFTVCGVFVALTIALIVWLSDTSATDTFSILLLAWTSLPYVLLALVPRIARRLRPGAGAAPSLIGSLVVAGIAAFIVFHAFFAQPDPQGPIVLLFLPVFQLVGVAAIFVVTLFTARRHA